MATEEKKVSKLDLVLNKIDAFFEGLMSSKKDDTEEPEEDDDMSAKKADDDADAKKAETAAPATKKATDDEDSQDPDDDDDTDKEDDDTYAKKDAEIKQLKSIVAKQNQLLKEAKSELETRDGAVRETIVSTFKPAGSQRSTKTAAVKAEMPSWARPSTELGKNATKLAVNKK
jgi:hypothetical protein